MNLFLFNLSRLTFKGPLNGKSFSNPKGKPNLKLILGACLFGIGWGLGGLCPGPFILLITGDSIRIPLYWGISFVVGRKLTIMAEYLSEPGKNKID